MLFFVCELTCVHCPTGSALLGGWLAIVILTVLVYWPGLGGGFAFDDYHVIVNNGAISAFKYESGAILDAAFSTATGPLKRPLALLSFALNHAVGGFEPFGYKITNLALHCCNAGLLLLLLRRVLPRLSGEPARRVAILAWLSALIWAVHPINSTAVLYIVQRMTLLASTFMLAGLLTYCAMRARQLQTRRVGWSLWVVLAGCWILGLASKETAVLLPIFVLVVEVAAFRFEGLPQVSVRARRLIGWAVGALAVVAVIKAETVFPGYAGREFSAGQRLLSEARVLVLYLHMLLVPDLSLFALFHDDIPLSSSLFEPWSTLPSVALVVVGIGIAVAGRPLWLAFAVGWFFAGHLLESTLVPLELAHEHRNYLASAGALAGLVLGLQTFANRLLGQRLRYLPVMIFIICVSTVTALRARDWSDPWSQMAIDLRHHPDSPRTLYEYGRLSVERAARHNDVAVHRRGVAAIERSAALSGNAFLALGALLKLAINDNDVERVEMLSRTVAEHASNKVRVEVLQQLINCQAFSACRNDPAPVLRLAGVLLADPALRRSHRRRALEWLAIYYLRVLADTDTGLSILRELAAEDGDRTQLQLRLAEALAANGQGRAAIVLARDISANQPWHFAISKRHLYGRLRRVLESDPGP